MSKVALVLSGGGAKGAFQFGAIKYIEEEIKKKYPEFQNKIIAGVSVGALNAVMMSMDKFNELEDIWNTFIFPSASLNSPAGAKLVSLCGLIYRFNFPIATWCPVVHNYSQICS